MFNKVIAIIKVLFIHFRIFGCRTVPDVIMKIGKPDISFPPNFHLQSVEKATEILAKNNFDSGAHETIVEGEEEKIMVYNWNEKYSYVKIEMDEFRDGTMKIYYDLGFTNIVLPHGKIPQIRGMNPPRRRPVYYIALYLLAASFFLNALSCFGISFMEIRRDWIFISHGYGIGAWGFLFPGLFYLLESVLIFIVVFTFHRSLSIRWKIWGISSSMMIAALIYRVAYQGIFDVDFFLISVLYVAFPAIALKK